MTVTRLAPQLIVDVMDLLKSHKNFFMSEQQPEHTDWAMVKSSCIRQIYQKNRMTLLVYVTHYDKPQLTPLCDLGNVKTLKYL